MGAMKDELETVYARTSAARTIFDGDSVTVRIADAQPRRFRVTFEPGLGGVVSLGDATIRLDPLF